MTTLHVFNLARHASSLEAPRSLPPPQALQRWQTYQLSDLYQFWGCRLEDREPRRQEHIKDPKPEI